MLCCRTSCVSSARVLVGKTIDLLVPWPAAMIARRGQAGNPVADCVAQVSWLAAAARK
jgi:hypothetical protein